MTKLEKDFWPKSIVHLTEPYFNDADDEVVIAEISGESSNGYPGYSQIHTALIPFDELEDALNNPGGIGYEVESHGPGPCVDKEGGYDSSFWVRGADKSNRYETLINSWLHHNKTVLLPDSGLLMCYGLVPRYIKDGIVCWDDPSRPVYDVIEVKSLSEYEAPDKHTYAYIIIRRDYFEDYLSLKGCAAVAVFYEERYSFDDSDIDEVLRDQKSIKFSLPGRKLILVRVDGKHHDGATQFTRVWGCRLILKPEKRSITEEPDPVLSWPDHDKPIDRDEAGNIENIYVTDDVLKNYEGRKEFSIHPESGNVFYGDWWGTSYSYRYGRHHIGVELRKLYEGSPPYVIRHFNKFAVPEAEAEKDKANNGDRHIGLRARDIIYAYLELIRALAFLADRMDLFLEQKDIGGFSVEEVNHYGWWTMEALKPLSYVISLEITQSEFLNRSKLLFKLLEHLKPGPLKQTLNKMGLPKTEFRDFGSLRLLGTICQLAKIAINNGDNLVVDFSQIYPKWDKNEILDELSSIFALNGLRTIEVHISEEETQQRMQIALESLGIEQQRTKTGWGRALDIVYDKLADSLNAAAQLILRAMSIK